ncbi:spore coat U domain-containing protein [Sphingomonas sp. S1-29]|uniref:Csu type fimbrial protein n=1 Tax=Sphingomonas sp. S1-29 TaxID=2991074 RepID=UPI00224089D4|nr:spore coat U domain-containing protein [Sphingomonas sp. S1-29]UZK69059.1 spore coat U domain-containing protein [Sphingomonas sp. S1-29]
MQRGRLVMIARSNRHGWLALLTLWGATLMPLPALAANCSVSSESLNFGQYDPFSSAPSDAASTITVSCDAETAFEIAVTPGAGSYAARTMTHGDDVMAYNLYIDPQRTAVWGDGTGSTSAVSAIASRGDFTIYGRAPAGQNLRPGLYTDTLSITVTY